MAEGEEGELVFTTLQREAMPIIRFRTGDLARYLGDDCGYRPGHPMISWIKGRVDDIVKIRGISLYPIAIEKIVMSDYRFGSNYQIVLEGYDDIVVVTEAAKEASAEERRALAEELEQKIHSKMGLRVRAEVLPPGGMPPSEGKAKRLVDRRKV